MHESEMARLGRANHGLGNGTLEYKIPKRPIRKKITGLPAFTTVRGGAYFLLPGIKALRYLAALPDVRRA